MRKSRILIIMMFSVMAVIWAFHYFELPLYEWTRPLMLIPIVYGSIYYGDLGMTAVLLFMIVGQSPLVVDALEKEDGITLALHYMSAAVALGGLGVIMGLVVRVDRKRNMLWKSLKDVRARIFTMDNESEMLHYLCEVIKENLQSDDVKCFLKTDDGSLRSVTGEDEPAVPPESFYYEVMNSEELFIGIDPLKDPRLDYVGDMEVVPNFMNIAVLPLQYGEKNAGVVEIVNSKIDDFGEESINIASEIKSCVESALTLAEKRRERIMYAIKHEEIKEMFSSYVSSTVAEEILKNPDRVELGGENYDASVMFTKIRNFRNMRKELPAEKIFEMLNRYFSVAIDTVFEYGGTLDKFIDDGVMAYWGAPLPAKDHAERSVRCAATLIQRVKALNEDWKREGLEPFGIGIGINSGQVIAGNIGGSKRMEYTVIGDTVNTASRIKGVVSDATPDLLISESTYDKVKNDYAFDESLNVEVKGKSGKIAVYGLRA